MRKDQKNYLYHNELKYSKVESHKRVFIAVGFTGVVRVEWMFARYGQIIPCNWSQFEYQMFLPTFGPLGYLVAEQRNIAVARFLESNHEWILFIDHDTVLPILFLSTMNDRIIKEKIPVWSGLYFTKSVPSEPILYRGQGGGYFADWKMGDKVWVDGIPMGCTVIHRSILEVMHKESPEYLIQGDLYKKVFESPQRAWIDPETDRWMMQTGTEDLHWCWRVIEHDVFRKAGWPKFAKMKYPFMVDTTLFCKHIDFNGIQYPSRGEENYFMRKKRNERKNENKRGNSRSGL